MASDLKTILFEDVLKHTKSKDCWLVINGKVYDVSEFMDEHPGGDDVMLATTGKDASDDFEDTGHSDYAKGLMKQFCIGEIDMSTVPNKRAGYVHPQETHIQEKSSGSLAKILQFLLPLVILGLAFVIRSYTKEK